MISEQKFDSDTLSLLQQKISEMIPGENKRIQVFSGTPEASIRLCKRIRGNWAGCQVFLWLCMQKFEKGLLRKKQTILKISYLADLYTKNPVTLTAGNVRIRK